MQVDPLPLPPVPCRTVSDLTRFYRREDMHLARFIKRTRFPGWQAWCLHTVLQARQWHRETMLALRRERGRGGTA